MMTLTLTPDLERRLTAYAKQKQKPVERVIEEWVEKLPEAKPTLKEDDEDENAAPLYETLSEEEFEKWMDELAEIGRDWGSLPDSAFDRELIYEDRL